MRIKHDARVGAHSADTGGPSGDWQNREMTATRRSSETRRRGSLHPVELAHASVMAALCAATAIIAVVVPFAAGISLLGTVPMGLLVYRFRLRVLIAATVAGATIAFLIAGMGGFMTVDQLRLHRSVDRSDPAAWSRHADGPRRRVGRGRGVRGRGGGSAGGPGPAAPPDLRIDDRQRRRHRGVHGGAPELAVAARHGGLSRAPQERVRHGAELLAIPARRMVGDHHHRRDV